VHMLSMSMGGLPSQAWADAGTALYDAGVFVVTAAGKNYANLPSHLIVYPARFNRVVAVCGAMADGTPYANLKPTLMAGDYGPEPKMATAMPACSPNVLWRGLASRTSSITTALAHPRLRRSSPAQPRYGSRSTAPPMK